MAASRRGTSEANSQPSARFMRAFRVADPCQGVVAGSASAAVAIREQPLDAIDLHEAGARSMEPDAAGRTPVGSSNRCDRKGTLAPRAVDRNGFPRALLVGAEPAEELPVGKR